MSWEDILKATYMPMGKDISEKIENIVYVVRQNYPNNAMDEFEQKFNELLDDSERRGSEFNKEIIPKIKNLQNYFTREGGIRDAYIDIVSEFN